jgi:hypothetical protein
VADDDKIKERIRRMLALAEDERNAPGERENALARATELITAHQLDRAMFADAGDITEKVTFREFTYQAPYTGEKSTLLGWLASALGMEIVNWSARGVYSKSHVYGFPSDLELLDMLYTSLLLQQVTGMRKAKVPRYLYRGEVAAWRRDWLRAFASTVSQRVKAAHSRATQQYDTDHAGEGKPGAELTLTRRSAQVQAAFELAHPKLKTRKARAIRHYDALEGGQEAGARADIGLTRVGGKRTQIGAGR